MADQRRRVMGRVDQLLFGYRDGHELITGSRHLSPMQLLDVLPHVDASIDGDEARQLVGTWIPSLASYLLARIWPASEHLRVGAVWAHVLLLSGEQLDRGRVSNLLGLIRRPSDTPLEAYAEALQWPPASPLRPPPPPLAHALALAADPGQTRSHVVLWPSPVEAEEALVSLLDILPARRRAALSFRTRERARPGESRYRVQVAASLSGPADELVIDARQPDGPIDTWARS